MTDKIFPDMTKLTSTAMGSFKELGEINTRLFEQLTEYQMATMSKFFTDTPNKIKELSEAKGYKELVAAQSDVVKQYSDECLGAMRKTVQIMSATRDDLTKWVEKGLTVVSEAAEAVPMPMVKKVA